MGSEKTVPGIPFWRRWLYRLIYRFRTISKGKVYQSSNLPMGTLSKVVGELGIQTVVDLRQFDGDHNGPAEIERENLVLSNLEVRYVHFSSRQVPSQETIDTFLKVMDDSKSYPVLIHCHHGLGKSRIVSAIYLIEFEGWTNEQARRAQRLFPDIGGFSPTAKKGRYICKYLPRKPAR